MTMTGIVYRSVSVFKTVIISTVFSSVPMNEADITDSISSSVLKWRSLLVLNITVFPRCSSVPMMEAVITDTISSSVPKWRSLLALNIAVFPRWCWPLVALYTVVIPRWRWVLLAMYEVVMQW